MAAYDMNACNQQVMAPSSAMNLVKVARCNVGIFSARDIWSLLAKYNSTSNHQQDSVTNCVVGSFAVVSRKLNNSDTADVAVGSLSESRQLHHVK